MTAVLDPVDETSPPRTRRWRRPLSHVWVQGGLVALAVAGVYLLTCSGSNPFNQYVRLADAFLSGRAYLVSPPDYLELARYTANGAACQGADPGCHGYVVEPLVPALVLVPFVMLFGVEFDQVYVSVLLGAAAMGLFWVASRQLGWTRSRSAAITVMLAVGTGFWWAAGDGAVWTFGQVCAVFFLMAALVEATGRRRFWLVGLLVGLAGLSRLPAFLAFPFFLVLALDAPPWRALWRERRAVLSFGATLGAMALVVPLYNLARYGTIRDAGYAHPQYADAPFFADGHFSISYVPRQLQAMLLAGPQLTEGRFPFFAPTAAGLSLLVVTPALLFACAARMRRVEVAAAVSVALVMIPHLLYGAVGFAQFGYRYALDYLPMLAVLVASGMGERPGVRAWTAVALSVLVAVWGPVFFFDTPLEALLGVQWRL